MMLLEGNGTSKRWDLETGFRSLSGVGVPLKGVVGLWFLSASLASWPACKEQLTRDATQRSRAT